MTAFDILIEPRFSKRNRPWLIQIVDARVFRILAQDQAGPIQRAAQDPLLLQLQALVLDRSHLHLLLPEKAGDYRDRQRGQQQRRDHRHTALPIEKSRAHSHTAPSRNILSRPPSRPSNRSVTSSPVGSKGLEVEPAEAGGISALTPERQPPLTHSRISMAVTSDWSVTSWAVSVSFVADRHSISSSRKSRVAVDSRRVSIPS